MDDFPPLSAPTPVRSDPALLAPEWARIGLLVGLAEALRAGLAPPEDAASAFAEAQAAVDAAREGGAWAGLRRLIPGDAALAEFTPFDLDLLALAVAPLAAPALAPRLHALQGFLATPFAGLPLLQELLMLDGAGDVEVLMGRLAPTAPLIAGGALRLERIGDYLAVQPTRRLVRALLDRPAEPGPPPGADLVPCPHGWDALVLPEGATRRLRELAGWIAARDTVFGAWGGRRIGGPMALISGPSGVGKSFAVSVLTRELRALTGAPWALYRLDLGRIVSKYVGETEKNLNALLDALHGTPAVLQIDEADGLLGKRGEVAEARDRYANLEVSHMLSRFETHDGPVILTTNLRANIDAAFLRRFQAVIDVPAPDAEMRAALWSRLLPAGAPRERDVTPELLGAAAALPGGAIHNAAIYAAVLAAQQGGPIALAHIARACWYELGKEARGVRKSELGALAAHLPETEALT